MFVVPVLCLPDIFFHFSQLKQVHSVIEWLSFHKHTASISYTDCGSLWKIYKGMKINNLYPSQALGFFFPPPLLVLVCECIHIVRGRKEEEQRSESQCFGVWERGKEEWRAVTDSPPFLHLLSETNTNFSLVCAVVVFPLLSLFSVVFSVPYCPGSFSLHGHFPLCTHPLPVASQADWRGGEEHTHLKTTQKHSPTLWPAPCKLKYPRHPELHLLVN